jgi:hypothetical protein
LIIMQNDKRSPSNRPNLPHEFGPPIRRPQQSFDRESLVDLSEDLHQHEWSHMTNNYRDYIQSVKAESNLFSRAMSLGPLGVDTFRRVKEDSIRSLINTAAHQAAKTERDKGQEALQKQKAAFEAILTAEQKELMAFREKLERHDWWYDYIDETAKWRGHDEHHKALLKEARLCGKAFEDVWVAVYKEKIGSQAQAWTFDQHYANHGLR